MLAADGYGGLEHAAGSANLYHPAAFTTRKRYEGLLELLSHELFHAWNGKRIAPAALRDVDYQVEAYTRCLWLMEGLTSHYDRFALRTSGRIGARSLLDKVLDDWARLQATPGRTRHLSEASSFNTWIKLYRPDESNLNTTVSYYLKGGLTALSPPPISNPPAHRGRARARRRAAPAVGALRRRRRAAAPEELLPDFGEATGLDLADTFARVIRHVEDPPLPAELAAVGLTLRQVGEPGSDGAPPRAAGRHDQRAARDRRARRHARGGGRAGGRRRADRDRRLADRHRQRRPRAAGDPPASARQSRSRCSGGAAWCACRR